MGWKEASTAHIRGGTVQLIPYAETSLDLA